MTINLMPPIFVVRCGLRYICEANVVSGYSSKERATRYQDRATAQKVADYHNAARAVPVTEEHAMFARVEEVEGG